MAHLGRMQTLPYGKEYYTFIMANLGVHKSTLMTVNRSPPEPGEEAFC